MFIYFFFERFLCSDCYLWFFFCVLFGLFFGCDCNKTLICLFFQKWTFLSFHLLGMCVRIVFFFLFICIVRLCFHNCNFLDCGAIDFYLTQFTISVKSTPHKINVDQIGMAPYSRPNFTEFLVYFVFFLFLFFGLFVWFIKDGKRENENVQ